MCAKNPLRSALLAGLLLAFGSSAAALSPGDKPPPIDLPDTKTGKKVDLESLVGRVVLIDFWASWCGPCREEMPVLESFHEKYAADGLVIVGVNIDNSKKKMNNFLKGSPVTFSQVRDEKRAVASRYQPATMPSSYLVGRDGRLRRVYEGFRKSDAALLEADIKKLLAEPQLPTTAAPSK